jgi:hypothetical protein
MPTHKEEIMRRLHRGETLTRRDALLEFGCGRLAARINELRDEGHPIETTMVDVKSADGSTARVARYSLPQREEVPFGSIAVGTRFELGGQTLEKADAFSAVGEGVGGGTHQIDADRTVILTD